MLPSRGLRPAHFAPVASRQAASIRSNAARKFSSESWRRTSSISVSSRSPLQYASWRTGATLSPPALVASGTVRHASWFRWSTPDATPTMSPETSPKSEPVVTAATPELAPGGIEKSAVADSTETIRESWTVEELLSENASTAASAATPEIDPSVPISHFGQLKELGLDYGFGPSSMYQWLIEHVYIMSDFGWAGTVIATAIILRGAILFPLQCYGSHSASSLAALRPVLQPLQDKLADAKQRGDDIAANKLQQQMSGVMNNHKKAFVMQPLVMIAQVAFGFGAFRVIRGMIALPVPGLSTEGMLWFGDLTARDPYFILPVAIGAILYRIFQIGGETGVQMASPNELQKMIIKYAPIFMSIFTAFQPACVQIYFFTTSALGLATGSLLRQNWFRKALRMQKIPTQESNELFSKVVSGEIDYQNLPRGADGKIISQAPALPKKAPSKLNQPSQNASFSHRGINIKAGSAIPLHLKAAPKKVDKATQDRDTDFDEGMPQGSVRERVGWIRRNYSPRFIWRRLVRRVENKDLATIARMRQKEKAQKKQEEYERERQRRIAGRR